MTRQHLLQLLNEYNTKFPAEATTTGQFIDFVTKHDDCFERSLLIGHVTASGWVLNNDQTSVLLMHHLKLDKWLQPGGHCDGDPDTLHVAMKECWEETGLQVQPISTAIFDIDIHEIPQRKEVPAHLHYDIRYLLRAEPDSAIAASEQETLDVKWVSLADVKKYSTEESVTRMLDKTIIHLQNR
jgi:8-oxo-dGTP pyrophosphatase MutT (NUDIX family)